MGRNIIWSSPEINLRTSFIQHLGENVFYYSKLMNDTRMSVFNNHPNIRLMKDKYQHSFDCNKSSRGGTPAKIIEMAKGNLQYQ